MLLPQVGDSLPTRSAFTPVAENPDGRAILTCQWGCLYVVDGDNRVEYVGDNPISAEVAFLSPYFELEEEVATP